MAEAGGGLAWAPYTSRMNAAADLTAPERAAALDAADPLASFRERFVVTDPSVVYFDGNSLGRLPRATADRLRSVVDGEWADRLIRSWSERWLDLPGRVGDLLGTELLGARAGEVLVADSTTVNFYRLAVAALDARPGRRAIVLDRDDFPTDRYVLEGLAGARGLELRWLDADPLEGPTAASVGALLDEDVALVALSHVNYRSAALSDMAGITAAAHGVGALTLWDLSHTVGAVPIALEATGADLAVGCTYKYLNGGPGAPAFLYVRAALQETLRNPIWGWFGRREQFEMAQGYEPETGIGSWLVGTPSVLALSAVEEGARLSAEAGIGRIRAKSIALTDYAIALHDAWLAPLGCVLRTPREPGRRGGHVSIGHPDARGLCAQLTERGVIPDFRAPDAIRIGLSPLTTSFADVHRGLAALRDLLAR